MKNATQKLTPAMRAIEIIARGGHFYGNAGIATRTLDALKRRGLIEYRKRFCPVSQMDRDYATLTAKGREVVS